MPTIRSFDKAKIYYSFHRGSRVTIIFVHGWLQNHSVWHREIEHFSEKDFSVIAPDLRGHGMSEKPQKLSDYKMDRFARDIKQIMKKNKIKKPVLVGHSFGGMVLLKFTELFPKSTKALVLIDSTYKNPLKSMPVLKHFKSTRLTRHLLKYIMEHKELRNKNFPMVDFSKLKNHSDLYHWFKGAGHIPVKSLVASLKAMVEFDEPEILRKIDVPFLLIEGEKDREIPKSVAINMHEELKKSKLFFIKNASHNTPIRNSEQINRALETFLASL